MKHFLKQLCITALCAVPALYGCAGNPFNFFKTNQNNQNIETPLEENTAPSYYHWFTMPQSGKLIIIGVSGRQLNRQTEIELAKEDAARKVSMFHGINVFAQTIHSSGSGFLDYYDDFNSSFEYDQMLEKYIDRLSFDSEKDVFSGEGFLLIRFSYPADFSGIISYSPSGTKVGSRPDWINRPPLNTDSCIIAVGYANRQIRFRDTVMKSHEAAAVALVSQISTSISTSSVTDSAAYQNTETMFSQSSGRLGSFVVIETWIDPESLAAWTLAVALKP